LQLGVAFNDVTFISNFVQMNLSLSSWNIRTDAQIWTLSKVWGKDC
jgi:hypothetical protein